MKVRRNRRSYKNECTTKFRHNKVEYVVIIALVYIKVIIVNRLYKELLLITHSTFLFASSFQMRLNCIQIDFRHCRFDVINVKATFNNAQISEVLLQQRDRGMTETVERKPMSAGASHACVISRGWNLREIYLVRFCIFRVFIIYGIYQNIPYYLLSSWIFWLI